MQLVNIGELNSPFKRLVVGFDRHKYINDVPLKRNMGAHCGSICLQIQQSGGRGTSFKEVRPQSKFPSQRKRNCTTLVETQL